jgi:hypothetical protein
MSGVAAPSGLLVNWRRRFHHQIVDRVSACGLVGAAFLGVAACERCSPRWCYRQNAITDR